MTWDDKHLTALAEEEGMSVMEMLEEATGDSVAKGICTHCETPCEIEPDSDSGWCSECGKNAVKSCLVLAGIL